MFMLLFVLLVARIGVVGGNFEPNSHGETKIYTSQGTHKDYFGHTVAVHGEVLVVGAYAANTVIPESGSAFSFQKNMSGGNDWAENDFIAASQIYPHDYFGGSVSIWEHTIVIGAYLDQSVGSKSGSAFVFGLVNGRWKEKQKLTSMLTSSADYFGQDVSIFENHIVVGAYGHSDPASYYNGAAYVFERPLSSSKWTQQSFLLPSDAKDYQMFGYSVCIHNSTIAVGAYGDSSSGSNTGAVYIFRKTTQEAGSNSSDWMEVQKLSPRDPKSHANFGTSLDLSLSGISIYDSQGQDSYDLVVGASLATGSTSVTGAVYVFHSSSAATSLWTQYAKLYALDGTGDERFGSSVAIHGSFLAVGAPEDRSRGTDSGSAYVFELSPTESWTFQRKLIGNDTQPYDNFGSSCSLYETTLVIGAEKAFGAVDSSGAAYIFSADGDTRKKPPKSFFGPEETEQFVLFLAVLPVLLVLIPLVVCSGAVYVSSVHKTGGGEDSEISPPPFAPSRASLEHYASLNTTGVVEHDGDVDSALDSSSSSSSAPFSLSASRHGLLVRSVHTPSPTLSEGNGRCSQDEMVDRSGSSEDDDMDAASGRRPSKPMAIQDAIDQVTEESSPMLFYHLLHFENSRNR